MAMDVGRAVVNQGAIDSPSLLSRAKALMWAAIVVPLIAVSSGGGLRRYREAGETQCLLRHDGGGHGSAWSLSIQCCTHFGQYSLHFVE